MKDFLPISRADMKARGIEQLDFIVVTGDAYVDHPTFGTAIISRVIEAQGFTVGVVAQPDWKSLYDIQKLGKPKYGFFVGSGNIDSMVAHYTAAKRKRSDDAYTAGNKPGKRPDRAILVYSRMVRKAFPNSPLIIGGLEASLRRFAHYDYWDDAVRPSVLAESGADLLVYGMGELQTIEIARRLAAGEDIRTITDVRGTCYMTEPKNTPWGGVQCPDYELVVRDKKAYAKAARQQLGEMDEVRGRMLLQRHGGEMLVVNPPMRALNTEELDWVAELPYMRTYHPIYEKEGGVPAIQEVEFSITHNRGCFGACNFCALAFHQGRKVTVRSQESILREANGFLESPNFKGYISDVGGPTANFRRTSCDLQLEHGLCKEKKCLAPKPCANLKVDHSDYLSLLRKLRALPGVKKVFIRSGIRYDYMLEDPNDAFFHELVEHHVSGQLRVAPEHCINSVLDEMGKPHVEAYIRFAEKYMAKTKAIGKEQYLAPYLMSSHPGCTLEDAVELAVFLKKHRIHPDQVQDFYPTPGTISTCMYYTGLDPYTGKEVHVPKTQEEKAMQRALLQYFRPQNRDLVEKALTLTHRRELIGNGKDCLILPAKKERQTTPQKKGANSGWRSAEAGKQRKRK